MKPFLTITAASLLTQALLSTGDEIDYEEPTTFGGLDTASYDFSSYNSDNCDSSTTTSAPVANNDNANDNSYSDYSTYGSKYESQYSNYYSKYYNGANGDGGYDNSNDNGSDKQKKVLCDCTKKATKKSDKKDGSGSSFDNDEFSKCVNKEFGNNAWTWDHQYINKYKKDKSSDVVASDNDADADADADGDDILDPLPSTTMPAMGDDEDDEKSGLMNEESENFMENSDSNSNTHSFTHSDYMNYLAIFLMFLGSVLLITFSINCIKYVWKSYRLRSYEAIGETSKQTEQKQHKRIRLPRRKKHDIVRNDNEIYTIGDV